MQYDIFLSPLDPCHKFVPRLLLREAMYGPWAKSGLRMSFFNTILLYLTYITMYFSLLRLKDYPKGPKKF